MNNLSSCCDDNTTDYRNVMLQSCTSTDQSSNVLNNDLNRVDFNDCIGKILDRTNNDSSSARMLEQQGLPPLTHNELAELSYLCTATIYYDQRRRQISTKQTTLASVTSDLPSSPPKVKKNRSGKANSKNSDMKDGNNSYQLIQLDVEIDTITSLVDLLCKHVQAALGVHLLENAMEILKSGLSSERGGHEFDKVRNYCRFVVVHNVVAYHLLVFQLDHMFTV
jgi:hypothetical protein